MSSTLVHGDLPSSQSAKQPTRAMIQPPPVKKARSGPLADLIFGLLAKGSALITLGMLVAILGSLTISAWPAIDKYGLGFLTSTTWDPVKEEFGGLVMIYGTLCRSVSASPCF
jgi:phosphate transport system permease protein